jgi:indole-3-glycerol phosphate synthase
MILSRILDHKKAELRRKQSRGYLAEMKGRIVDRTRPLGFIHALEAGFASRPPALIAEVKRASPSQGFMRPEFQDRFEPVTIAAQYRDHGASALSVLTDQDFFQGSLEYLHNVKEAVQLPTLNKEFMVEDIQLYEARAYGADCILLIAAALDRFQLEDFFTLAHELLLDVLIEIHDERELDIVLERVPLARLIGINNRDLRTFSTDLGVTERLTKRIPPDKLIVSESGIHRREDVVRVLESGAKAMLIGESLLRADSIGSKIQELLRPPTSSKKEVTVSRWI